jgi:hypothetical protein
VDADVVVGAAGAFFLLVSLRTSEEADLVLVVLMRNAPLRFVKV